MGAILLSSLLIGCASLVNGTRQDLLVTSTPTGAHVILGARDFTTPATISVRRNLDHVVLVQKEGFQPQRVEVKRKLSYWWWLDLLIPFPLPGIADNPEKGTGGLVVVPVPIGLIVVAPLEWVTGSAFRLTPSDIHVDLIPEVKER